MKQDMKNATHGVEPAIDEVNLIGSSPMKISIDIGASSQPGSDEL